MKRLIQGKHGLMSRDSALIYIDGTILEGHNHPLMIKNYLNDRRDYGRDIIKKYCENKGFSEEDIEECVRFFDETGDLPPKISRDFTEWSRGNNEIKKMSDLALAFGHILHGDKEVFLESSSLVNVDLHTVTLAIKSKYPDYDVYDDDNQGEDGKYKKIAKLLKESFIDAILPISPINHNNHQKNNNQYLYEKNKEQKPNQPKSNLDTFERSINDPEYLYNSDGKFRETRSNSFSKLTKTSEEESKLFISLPPYPKTITDSKFFEDYFKNKKDNKIKDNRNKELDMINLINAKTKLKKIADKALDSLRSDRAKLDQGAWMLINSPPYATSDNSYMGYVNENPNNVYYKRLIKKDPNEQRKDLYTSEDFVNEFFEDDQFTLKTTK